MPVPPGLAARLALISLLALAGCQMALPFGRGAPPPAALPGGEIEVTALEPAANAAPATAADAQPGAPLSARQPEDAAPAEATPTDAEAPPETAQETPPETSPETLAAPKSDAQLRCERQGGDWASGSESALKTCVKPTGDGGKQCSRQTDCKGECLARSGTCAPISPLLGCNDILLADGTRTTQCIE